MPILPELKPLDITTPILQAYQIKNMRERTTLLKMQEERRLKQEAADNEMKTKQFQASTLFHAISAATSMPDDESAKQVLETFKEKFMPDMDTSKINIRSKGKDRELTITLPDKTLTITGPSAVLSQASSAIAENPEVGKDPKFRDKLISLGLSWKETEPKEKDFQKQAFEEWSKDNPGKTRMDFLKEKKDIIRIEPQGSDFERAYKAELKNRPNLSRVDFKREWEKSPEDRIKTLNLAAKAAGVDPEKAAKGEITPEEAKKILKEYGNSNGTNALIELLLSGGVK